MDWRQMVGLVSDIALPIFTAGLVFATVCLWRSTSRYTKISEELLRAEKIGFVGKMLELVQHPHKDRFNEVRKIFDESIVGEVMTTCRAITEQLLRELSEECSPDD